MKALVILPSYNERENIVSLIEAILKTSPEIDVCVVDDNSPDGTGPLLDEFVATRAPAGRVHLIHRKKKDGRGGAVRDGMIWGFNAPAGYEAFVEMDCDFSHPPGDLPKGLGLLGQADVVLGSRYPDGEIVGWPMRRRVLSFCANTLARSMITRKISDYTNGFRFYNRRAAEALVGLPQKHKGYIYLSESLSYLLKRNFKIAAFPIRFVNRERGQSNTNFREVSRSLLGIVQIGYEYRFKR
jgi:glycosyltransferase involved in cell wall biosynthesis